MNTYNKIMLYFWLIMGTLLLGVVTYLVATEGFAKWGVYYIFVAIPFFMFLIRRWMMKRMERHIKFMEEQESSKDSQEISKI